MAAVTGAVIAAGTAAYSANQQKKAAKRGANAIQAGADAATEEQRRQYNQSRTDMMPWLDFGRENLGRMNQLLSGDYSGFMTSPDYLAARDMGLQGLDRGAASRGALFSGGADADRIKFAGDLASQNLSNWWNRLAGGAGAGQTAASNLGSMGANAANQIGNNNMLAAGGRASSYQKQADANSQMAGAISGGFNDWLQGRGGVNTYTGGGMGAGTMGGFGNNPEWINGLGGYNSGLAGYGGGFGGRH
jgi:hypothetical protein